LPGGAMEKLTEGLQCKTSSLKIPGGHGEINRRSPMRKVFIKNN
jgi:hypothetical protein